MCKTSGKKLRGNVAFGVELVHASIHLSTSENCRFIGWAEWAWMIHFSYIELLYLIYFLYLVACESYGRGLSWLVNRPDVGMTARHAW